MQSETLTSEATLNDIGRELRNLVCPGTVTVHLGDGQYIAHSTAGLYCLDRGDMSK